MRKMREEFEDSPSVEKLKRKPKSTYRKEDARDRYRNNQRKFARIKRISKRSK